MTDCNAQGKDMTGDARRRVQEFLSEQQTSRQKQEAAMRQRQAVRQFLHCQG
jgi:hypothetical protein